MAGWVEVDSDAVAALGRACRELGKDVAASGTRYARDAPAVGDGYGHLPAAADAAEQHALSMRDLGALVEELRARCDEHAERLRVAAARCEETDARAAEEVGRLRRGL